jgi:hypothetical protein
MSAMIPVWIIGAPFLALVALSYMFKADPQELSTAISQPPRVCLRTTSAEVPARSNMPPSASLPHKVQREWCSRTPPEVVLSDKFNDLG